MRKKLYHVLRVGLSVNLHKKIYKIYTFIVVSHVTNKAKGEGKKKYILKLPGVHSSYHNRLLWSSVCYYTVMCETPLKLK